MHVCDGDGGRGGCHNLVLLDYVGHDLPAARLQAFVSQGLKAHLVTVKYSCLQRDHGVQRRIISDLSQIHVGSHKCTGADFPLGCALLPGQAFLVKWESVIGIV